MDIDGEGSANDSGDPSLSSDVPGVLKVETSAVATTTTGDKNAEENGRFEAVVASPYDAQLHIDNISGASTAESREEARSLMHSLMAMPEEIWLAWLHDRQAALNGSVKDIDAVLDLIQLYRSSFLDGLCESTPTYPKKISKWDIMHTPRVMAGARCCTSRRPSYPVRGASMKTRSFRTPSPQTRSTLSRNMLNCLLFCSHTDPYCVCKVHCVAIL